MNELRPEGRTPVSSGDERPPCFGVPEKVCPKDENPVIEPQAECLSCALVRSCLQQALRREGAIVDTTPVRKVSGFLRRWSDKKLNTT